MKTMIAKYPGTCRVTGARIQPGDRINYYGRGQVELATSEEDEQLEESHHDDEESESGWPPSRAQLRADAELHRQGLSVFRFSSGAVMTQNSRGRCEDAPCCGCCD